MSYLHVRIFKDYASSNIYVKTNMIYTLGMPKPQGRFSLDLLFRAFADLTRLRLLNLIADGDICVCYFVEILHTSQPKISRHLAYLRKAGIVTARRDGKWMHYRLAIPRDEVAARILRETLKHLREKPEMQRDILRLRFASCAPQKYAVLQGAPLPALMHTSNR
jgi:ArsR family transcriptional regulator, arsenate/arsenite/antimonite-responsive transcriptional repressor